MALAITATAGSATANSFATEVEAINRAASRLNLVGWTTVTGSTCTESEKAALIEATRELTRLHWDGAPVDDTQVLQWPRRYVINPDAANVTALKMSYPFLPAFVNLESLYFSTTAIPLRIKEATIELAFEFLKAGTTDLAALDSGTGIIAETVGPISTTWESASAKATGLARYPRVMTLISPLLAPTHGGMEIRRA